jgi:hypothetical protein
MTDKLVFRKPTLYSWYEKAVFLRTSNQSSADEHFGRFLVSGARTVVIEINKFIDVGAQEFKVPIQTYHLTEKKDRSI